jgi:hypothetical protein
MQLHLGGVIVDRFGFLVIFAGTRRASTGAALKRQLRLWGLPRIHCAEEACDR